MWMNDDRTRSTPALSVLDAARRPDSAALARVLAAGAEPAVECLLKTGEPAERQGRFTLLLQEIDTQMAELLLGKRKKDVEEEEEFDDEEEEEDDLEEDEDEDEDFDDEEDEDEFEEEFDDDELDDDDDDIFYDDDDDD